MTAVFSDELRARVGGVREVRAHTVKKRSGGLERGGRALHERTARDHLAHV